jgi:diguanylate cyclase (GGDEF)-like protein/PAS domain S-box-containing protein
MGRAPALTVQQLVGMLLGLFGLAAALRWVFQFDAVDAWVPGFGHMGVNTPAMFLLAAGCCVAVARPPRPGSRLDQAVALAAGLLVAYPGLALLQTLAGLDLGLDFVRVPTLPSEMNPHPGRMAPNTSIAFMAAGIAFLAGRRPGTALRLAVLAVAAGVVTLVGMAGLAGHLLGLEGLYRVAGYNRMLPPAAAGLCVLAMGLWLWRDQLTAPGPRMLHTHDRRITGRSIAVLTLVALSAGVAGYAVMRETFERAVSDNMMLAARTHATALGNALDTSLWLPRTVATRPIVAETLARLDAPGGDAEAAASLARMAATFPALGLDGVQFLDRHGVLLAQAGTMAGAGAQAIDRLTVRDQQAELRWQDGYVLHTGNDVVAQGRVVGRLVAQQRLRVVDRLLAGLRGSSESSDALVCSRSGDDAVCAPTRLYPQPLRIPMYDGQGRLNLPINHALLGASGVTITRDLRGVPVVAAYMPLQELGLGLVVKTDVQTLYAPLKQRLNALALLLVVLVAAGTWALRVRVRPLVAQLVAEQQRAQIMLDHSSDAFIALGVDGRVSDWNRAAEMTFGWTAAQAVGRLLSELIVPPAQRAAHDAGLQRFIRSGEGPVVNRRIEMAALHRDGHEVPVEMAIAAIRTPQGFVANAFVRDISARRAAEQRLQASEQLLRAVTDNLPVLIAYVDRDERLRFLNATFQDWLGIDPVQALGQPLREVIGPVLYEQRREHLQRALGGERVQFDVESQVRGGQHCLQTVYIPDLQPDGQVAGIYALATEVTALKAVERQLSALARFDTLTGLANRYQFNEKLPEAIARTQRTGKAMALMFLDVDHFKAINDGHGHAVGDAVLKEVALRLQHSVRATDTVARLAGDEFVVILENLHGVRESQLVARKILAQINRPFVIEGQELAVTMSIGVACHRRGTVAADDLLDRADQALYAAKAAGRNRFQMEPGAFVDTLAA